MSDQTRIKETDSQSENLAAFAPERLAAIVADILFTRLNARFRARERRLRKLEARLQKFENNLQQQAAAEYLRPQEVETRFRIGRDLLRDLVDAGHIKRYDAGAHARYRADELEGYLKRYHVSVGERR